MSSIGQLIEEAMSGVRIIVCPPCRGLGETLEGICGECRGCGESTTNDREVRDGRRQ